jgi:capsular polysaccharide transport system permease protein
VGRSSWRVTLAAWHALLLREAVSRMFSRRISLAWLLLEPVAHIAFMIFVFTVLRTRVVGGMDVAWWLASGLLAFFLFRRTAAQGSSAIGANLALFTYRQVQPVDTVITRCLLEGFLMLLVSAIIVIGLALAGVAMTLDDAGMVMAAALGLWLFALGWGLAVSVATEMVAEVGNIFGMLMLPMMLLSGVIFPLSAVPQPWQDWLLLNPVAHGVEAVRAGLAGYYHHVPGLSLAFLYGSALLLVFLGLALQVRFRRRMLAL